MLEIWARNPPATVSQALHPPSGKASSVDASSGVGPFVSAEASWSHGFSGWCDILVQLNNRIMLLRSKSGGLLVPRRSSLSNPGWHLNIVPQTIPRGVISSQKNKLHTHKLYFTRENFKTSSSLLTFSGSAPGAADIINLAVCQCTRLSRQPIPHTSLLLSLCSIQKRVDS